MEKIRDYDVEFSGLKNGNHQFKFEIREAFLELLEIETEFSNPRINATVEIGKHTNFLEVTVTVDGFISLICDITTEMYDLQINNETKFLVKFGEAYDDSNEEVIVISKNDHAINVLQFLYENIALAVPMKKVSPNITEQDIALLEKYSPQAENKIVEKEEIVDPRWETLKNLKDKIK